MDFTRGEQDLTILVPSVNVKNLQPAINIKPVKVGQLGESIYSLRIG